MTRSINYTTTATSGKTFDELDVPWTLLISAEGRNKAASDALKRFRDSVRSELRTYDLSIHERDELLTMLGVREATEKLLASNCRLRRRADDILCDLFGHLRQASLQVPNRTFWHGSFLGPLINEYQPRLDVGGFRNAVYRLIHRAGLNAVCVMEFQALTNYPQRGRGRSFLLNAHAMMWTEDTEFDAGATEERLQASVELNSELGAPTVRLSPRTLDEGQLEYLGHYLLKAPADGKYRRRNPANYSQWELRKVAEVRPGLRLRLMEILSHYEFTDLVFGVGDGASIRTNWKRKLVDWNSNQLNRFSQPLERDFDVGEIWDRVRKRPANGSRLYHPLMFVGSD